MQNVHAHAWIAIVGQLEQTYPNGPNIATHVAWAQVLCGRAPDIGITVTRKREELAHLLVGWAEAGMRNPPNPCGV